MTKRLEKLPSFERQIVILDKGNKWFAVRGSTVEINDPWAHISLTIPNTGFETNVKTSEDGETTVRQVDLRRNTVKTGNMFSTKIRAERWLGWRLRQADLLLRRPR